MHVAVAPVKNQNMQLACEHGPAKLSKINIKFNAAVCRLTHEDDSLVHHRDATLK